MDSSSSEGSSESVSPPQPHIVIFPFMSKTHTIPLLHFAHLLLRRGGVAVTIITTASNIPFVSHSLEGTAAAVLSLPFPAAGTQTTDQLPPNSKSLFFQFASATSLMQPHFDRLLRSLLPPVTFLVSDALLWWTLHSASRIGVPRLVFTGRSCYSHAIHKEVHLSGLFNGPQFDDEHFSLAQFPWIRLSKLDFAPEIRHPDPNTLAHDLLKNVISSTSKSHGIVANTFHELEPVFADYATRETYPKSWCIGPLITPNTEPRVGKLPTWASWLDQKQREKREVVYVSLGIEAEREISGEEVEEIAMGLEGSKVEFLWVVRRREVKIPEGFENRVRNRGMVVRTECVEDEGVLKHEIVKVFVSSCEWKSVVESVCVGVPVVAWPVAGDQYVNARMVEEEMKVGFKVEERKREGLERKVKEMMEGEKGREARKKAKEIAETAKKALEEGGSSWCALGSLIHEFCT